MAVGLVVLAVFSVATWCITQVRLRQRREQVQAVVGGRPAVWSASVPVQGSAYLGSQRLRLNLYGGWIEMENVNPGSRGYGAHLLFRSSEVRIEVRSGRLQPYICFTGNSRGRDVRIRILGARYEQEAVWRALVADGARPVGAGLEALER